MTDAEEAGIAYQPEYGKDILEDKTTRRKLAMLACRHLREIKRIKRKEEKMKSRLERERKKVDRKYRSRAKAIYNARERVRQRESAEKIKKKKEREDRKRQLKEGFTAETAVVLVTSIAAFIICANFAREWRGYQAIGGEAGLLLIPVVFYRREISRVKERENNKK